MSLRFITFDEAIELFKNGYTGSAFVRSASRQFWILKDMREATLDELIDGYIFTAIDPQQIAEEIQAATLPDPEPAAAPDPEDQKAEPEEVQAAAAERKRRKLKGEEDG